MAPQILVAFLTWPSARRCRSAESYIFRFSFLKRGKQEEMLRAKSIRATDNAEENRFLGKGLFAPRRPRRQIALTERRRTRSICAFTFHVGPIKRLPLFPLLTKPLELHPITRPGQNMWICSILSFSGGDLSSIYLWTVVVNETLSAATVPHTRVKAHLCVFYWENKTSWRSEMDSNGRKPLSSSPFS